MRRGADDEHGEGSAAGAHHHRRPARRNLLYAWYTMYSIAVYTLTRYTASAAIPIVIVG